jgi:hypothetical protein
MNREEQKQILEFIERAVKGRPDGPLPPMDFEADAIIRALFVRNSEAAYRITKLAMAQEAELELFWASTEPAEAPRQGFFARLFSRRNLPDPLRKTQLPALERQASG